MYEIKVVRAWRNKEYRHIVFYYTIGDKDTRYPDTLPEDVFKQMYPDVVIQDDPRKGN